MKRVPLWILGATLGSFAAGMNVGLVLPKVFAADKGAPVPEADYVHGLVECYGLTSAQERSVWLVLQSAREEEMAVYRGSEPSQLPPEIRRSVLAVRSRTLQRIRAVFDDGQRARFDADSRPQEPK